MFLLVTLALADTLSWSQAVDRALTEGVDAQRAALAVQEAERVLRARLRQWDPSLTATADANSTLVGTGLVTSADVRLVAAMPLWTGGDHRARVDLARADQTAATADRAATRQATVLAVADALVAVDEARASVEVERSVVEAELATEARVAAQVDAGARTRADALQQRAAVATAQARLVGAEQALVSTTLDAALLLRLDPATTWTFAGPADEPMVTGDAPTLVARAWSNRPELGVRMSEADAAAATLRSAQAGQRPLVNATAGVSAGVSSSGGPVGTQLADSGYPWVGLDVTVPILDRGTTRAAADVARLDIERASLELAAAREQVAIQVRSALAARDSARATLTATQVRQEAAAAALDVVQQRYDAGAALFVELAAARTSAAEADRAATAATADVTRASFALAWAVGGLDPAGTP